MPGNATFYPTMDTLNGNVKKKKKNKKEGKEQEREKREKRDKARNIAQVCAMK